MRRNHNFPDGKQFAFTILDDTDDTTLKNGKPVYDRLAELGFRTTKTVWTISTPRENSGPYWAAETLENEIYFNWTKQLHDDGFEIAFHNATMGTSPREDTIRALDFLEKNFTTIRLHCNHGQNKENLHWGHERYSNAIIAGALKLLNKVRPFKQFTGNVPGSPHYWADVCDERITYMRAFAFHKLNCSKIIPGRPFLDPNKQQKTLFFNTVDAPDVTAFNRLVNKASINKLQNEGGWAIVSTHLGKGFYWDDKINPEFDQAMQYLSRQNGWYVPASDLLDHLKQQHGTAPLSTIQNFSMETGQLYDRAYDHFFHEPFYEWDR